MAQEATTQQQGGEQKAPEQGGAALTRRGQGPGGLQTSKGATTIADTVVTKVVGLAAREVPGVHNLGGGTARAVGALSQKVGMSESNTQGVSVEVGETEAAADLTVVIEYGESIPKVAQQVRERVTQRVEGITGLKITEVNIEVNDLHFPGDDEEDEQPSRVQ